MNRGVELLKKARQITVKLVGYVVKTNKKKMYFKKKCHLRAKV